LQQKKSNMADGGHLHCRIAVIQPSIARFCSNFIWYNMGPGWRDISKAEPEVEMSRQQRNIVALNLSITAIFRKATVVKNEAKQFDSLFTLVYYILGIIITIVSQRH